MLSMPDADVVRRDPALPGLAVLLDTERFAQVVSPALDRRIESAAIDYVKYRPGRYCRVGYHVEVSDGAISMHAVGLPAPMRAVSRTKDQVKGSSRFCLPDLCLEISLFPDDQRLAVLPRLGSAGTRADVLAEILPAHPDLWNADIEVIRYRPQRRFVGRLLVDGQCRGVIKVYADSEYQTARANAGKLYSKPPLKIAAVLGDSPQHRAIVLEWLPGRLLFDLVAESGFQASQVERVGQALAHWHGQSSTSLHELSSRQEAESMTALATDVGRVCPHLANRVEQLAARLAELSVGDAAICPIHGDFSPRQVLLDEETVPILDYDDARLGTAAVDLGDFAARLRRRTLRRELTGDMACEVYGSLLEGYRRVRELPPGESLRRQTAVGLLRLAPRPFRKRDVDWPLRTEELIDSAEAVLRKRGKNWTWIDD